MDNLIIVFGILILAAGISFFVKPGFIFDFLKRESNNINLQIFAITARLVLGFLLIYFSDTSRYPTAVVVLGWFIIAAAITLLLIGRKNFQRLIEWVLSFLQPYTIFGGLLAIAFGVFLIYAFI